VSKGGDEVMLACFVTELQTVIRTYIDSYNERAKPFSWTKTAEELLEENQT
jgi:hypothetical protein